MEVQRQEQVNKGQKLKKRGDGICQPRPLRKAIMMV